MIDVENKFVFVHIPKTGGTSFEYALNGNKEVEEKHLSLHQLDSRYSLDDFFKFSIVRNPWDITVSMYNYMWLSNYDWPKNWRSKIGSEFKKMTFRDWIKHETFKFPTLRSVDLLQKKAGSEPDQLSWLSSNGEVQVDYICRYESLRDDFIAVCSMCGLGEVDLPHINISPKLKNNFLSYYDEETYSIVEKKIFS